MKWTLQIIIFLLLLTGCKTSKKITSEMNLTSGSSLDSIAVWQMRVDSASWSASNDSSVTSSIRYDVLRDSVGQPMMDDKGAPITYVIQRDTVWRVVNIDKAATATILQHDTIQVTRRDTIVVKEQIKSTTKTSVANSFGFHVFLIIIVCVLLVIACVVKKCG